ncbi:hypothetical protein X943_003362 [Babesia divergens]|uniref:Uncharacterized protein n=1 Tax=Babesia divergens TaxID=32595 RepID=A0AAD9G7Q3_BABDI|nr:hypothetical protein X943_003362 [Babesia divergens]
MASVEGLTLRIATKAVAIGLWNGEYAVVLQHRGPVFHKLARNRGGNVLVLNEEETVFALMRTTFALFHADTYEMVTAESILSSLLAAKQYRRLLKVHVYLGVIALGKTPETIDPEVDTSHHRRQIVPGDNSPATDSKSRAEVASISHSTDEATADVTKGQKTNVAELEGRSQRGEPAKSGLKLSTAQQKDAENQTSRGNIDSLSGTCLNKTLQKLQHLLQETEIVDTKAMPYEVMERFKNICGTIYPIEPLTIERPLFAVEGTWVYAVTADAGCLELLERLTALNPGNGNHAKDEVLTSALCGHHNPERSDKTTVHTYQTSTHSDDAVDPDRSGSAPAKCVVAVSNFDSIYFLNIKDDNKY